MYIINQMLLFRDYFMCFTLCPIGGNKGIPQLVLPQYSIHLFCPVKQCPDMVPPHQNEPRQPPTTPTRTPKSYIFPFVLSEPVCEGRWK